MTAGTPKEITWVGSSRDDLQRFPDPVRKLIGFALFQAQCGGKHLQAKPLKGFKGGGVIEVVDDFDGDAFRTVYTVRFAEAVYVLHAFQKKSKSGIQTPRHEMDMVRARLKIAQEWHRAEMDLREGR
jgi:phage-related protein